MGFSTFFRGLLALCRGCACRVSINGSTVARGAIVSNQDCLPNALTISTKVRNDEPFPSSRFLTERRLTPACAARAFCSRFLRIRSLFRWFPNSTSISSGVLNCVIRVAYQKCVSNKGLNSAYYDRELPLKGNIQPVKLPLHCPGASGNQVFEASFFGNYHSAKKYYSWSIDIFVCMPYRGRRIPPIRFDVFISPSSR